VELFSFQIPSGKISFCEFFFRHGMCMTPSFQYQHGAMLLRYSGISFISGAVNHGFFSGERSLWTAAIGMVLFVLGAVLEHRVAANASDTPKTCLLQTLVWGSLLSIGLGFFTGGLQHFPDSPARSSWVVPLGFVVSVCALAWSGRQVWQRAATVYVLVLGALVSAGSWGAWQWLEQHPEWAASGHSHAADNAAGTTDAHHGDDAPRALVAQVVSRSIDLRMDDQMRFTPALIEVQAGETVRFVVLNAGQTAHEMVLGSEEEIRTHAQAMRQGTGQEADHSHGTGAAIHLAAGQTGQLVVHFAQAQKLLMACLIPGHYEAGMRGTVNVLSASKPLPNKPLSQQPSKDHDHSAHTH
jgi:uncharacterized cupredoxin-like copper-binding protein